MSTKRLLLATAFATILSLPAYATDAPPPSFDGTTGTNAVKAAPGDLPADGAAPTTMDPTSSPPAALAAPAPGADSPATAPTDLTSPAANAATPTAATAPATPVPAEAPATAQVPATPDPASAAAPAPLETAPAGEDEMAAPTTTEPAPASVAPAQAMSLDEPTPSTETATPVTAPEEPVKAAEPVVKKSPPAKLSALAKKYDLMGLDTNGDKSLSKAEFTANGFANAKVFAAFDADHNGKLTNSEINAYASNIERNINK